MVTSHVISVSFFAAFFFVQRFVELAVILVQYKPRTELLGAFGFRILYRLLVPYLDRGLEYGIQPMEFRKNNSSSSSSPISPTPY